MKKKWFFNIIEEAILNQDFIKKYPNMRGGRIKIWYKDYQYDVEEIRLLLPKELWVKVSDALDFKECDVFQIGEIRSEELEKWVKKNIHSTKTPLNHIKG